MNASPGPTVKKLRPFCRRHSSVRRAQRIGRRPQRRARVERDVVVDELPDEGRARSMARVVGIVRAPARVDDELDRAGAELVLGVQRAALRAQRPQRFLDALSRRSERRQVWKQPSKVLPIGRDESAARGCPHERTRQSRRSAAAQRQGARTCTGSRQKSAPAIASRQRSAIVLLGHLNPPAAAQVLSAPRRANQCRFGWSRHPRP
jgi:hypothetical protein